MCPFLTVTENSPRSSAARPSSESRPKSTDPDSTDTRARPTPGHSVPGLEPHDQLWPVAVGGSGLCPTLPTLFLASHMLQCSVWTWRTPGALSHCEEGAPPTQDMARGRTTLPAGASSLADECDPDYSYSFRYSA